METKKRLKGKMDSISEAIKRNQSSGVYADPNEVRRLREKLTKLQYRWNTRLIEESAAPGLKRSLVAALGHAETQLNKARIITRELYARQGQAEDLNLNDMSCYVGELKKIWGSK